MDWIATRTSNARRDSDETLSWRALLATLLVNLLAWTALVSVYQRANAGLAPVEVERTPIVWLRPSMDEPRRLSRRDPPMQAQVVRGQHAPRVRSQSPLPSPVDGERAVQPTQPAAEIVADDDWHVGGREGEAGASIGHHAPSMAADPLQLRRRQAFPASIARLRVRMRGPGGFASRAQAKVCGALLGQWEGLRMNAANSEPPPGLQPAGREAVWRTLQQEGCLD